ncbi:MAG TPA: hypothetical protein VKT73_12875 [Xanthobacteraceae bacterium]|nr:hypothetical protein [Xanthobacteraceae bacterium]
MESHRRLWCDWDARERRADPECGDQVSAAPLKSFADLKRPADPERVRELRFGIRLLEARYDGVFPAGVFKLLAEMRYELAREVGAI